MHLTSLYKPVSVIFDFTFPVLSESQVIAHRLNNLNSMTKTSSNLFMMITLDVRYILVYWLVVCCIHSFFFLVLGHQIHYQLVNAFVKYRFLKMHSAIGYFFRKRFGPNVSKLLVFNLFMLLAAIFVLTNLTQMFLADSIKTSKASNFLFERSPDQVCQLDWTKFHSLRTGGRRHE